ncbi:MAG: hypothetical protein H7Y31_10140 [Chitinophagaceae bacterium]|nr:hypothetical protein [Chitinophagaceae bacterium]
MDSIAFQQSLSNAKAPAGLSIYLESLWYDGKGDWDQSHNLIQDLTDNTAAWIHAYLHRKEGDNWNADYWYQKAGRKRPGLSLQEEWEAIVTELLTR